eukprot:TRINITY_DN18338_c0_g1_i1.p1 TRINITY_DN18338_c0_g1~~TRINITY_DN18338_c0_g1_i1.p1  ORF type:complete len:252 (-),score=45.58 TRINITY_DN18338_c0_g1_i1:285-959(-)
MSSVMALCGADCNSCRFPDPATSTVRINLEDINQILANEEHKRYEADSQAQGDQLAEEILSELRAKRQSEAEEEALRMQEAREAKAAGGRILAEVRTQARAGLAPEASMQKGTQAQQGNDGWEEIQAFLKKHGFSGVNSIKRYLMSSTYPLHKAAELGDEKMVALLLQKGADPSLKNSSSKTAAEVAKKKDKSGSHATVHSLLVSAAAPKSPKARRTAPRAGGA